MAPKNAAWDGTDSEGNPLTWDREDITWDGLVPEPITPPNPMPLLRVSLSFTRLKDPLLHEFAGTVSGSLYGLAAYPDPTVAQPALDAANEAFDTSISAQEKGGAAATAAKKSRRAALVALLRDLAAYVQRKCNNDLATLLASGFKAVNTSHTSTLAVGDVPAIRGIKNGNSTQLILRVKAVKNAYGYIIRYAIIGADGVPGPWVETDPFTDSRRILIEGLKPGNTYAFQARATLAKSRTTGWSDTVQHMSM